MRKYAAVTALAISLITMLVLAVLASLTPADPRPRIRDQVTRK
jgi:hypothetical protein